METTQYIVEELKTVFAPVAAKIGEGAEFGWDVVLRQMWIEGIIAMIFAFFAFLVIIVVLIITYTKRKYIIEETDGIAFVFLLFLLLPLIIGLTEFSFGIKHLLNPEFYAIQFFLDLVK